jgi:hypothetical protein
LWALSYGGFSLWQLEEPSIYYSMIWLTSHQEACVRAGQWIFNDPNAPANWPHYFPTEAILWTLRCADGDRLGVLLVRLHYMRVPTSIPETVEAQAEYWKRWYNTLGGKGTVAQYLENWERYCAETVANYYVEAGTIHGNEVPTALAETG